MHTAASLHLLHNKQQINKVWGIFASSETNVKSAVFKRSKAVKLWIMELSFANVICQACECYKLNLLPTVIVSGWRQKSYLVYLNVYHKLLH